MIHEYATTTTRVGGSTRPICRVVGAWSDQDSVHSSSKRCRIAHIIHMSDEPVPSLDLDELVDMSGSELQEENA